MPETLSYTDAVRLLGGQRSKVVTALDALTGGAMLATATSVPAVLGWFDAKAEFVRLSHDLVRQVSERRSGLSRYDRTERVAAAHRVLVVTAFFEVLGEVDLPFRLGELELTGREQLGIVGVDSFTGPQSLASLLLDRHVPLPTPQRSHRAYAEELTARYRAVADRLAGFVRGLAVWERLPAADQGRFTGALAGLPDRAVRRHGELVARLAVDFPEVAYWAGLREHDQTRDEVRSLATSLAAVESTLAAISTGRAPDQRREALARAYRAALDRPIVEAGDVPPGLSVPSLGAAYQPPLCRIAELGSGARPSDETWWAEAPVRDDLAAFLTGHLTGPGATRTPLLVLGQPGSGKSVLTKVLAARLPAADFLPVRVLLREVPAAGDLQDQIEYALRQATGERLDWPALVRSAGDALPVVLLDGFDELLQATGVSQTDYLRKVAAFQRREADQGRPVVVVVTSRTSVADRAEAPAETVALRLEPFDDARVTEWLAVWNADNADHFAARGVAPLEPATVLAHPELAGQPLLLLMLALYDADSNALRGAETLRRDQLYERLLYRFAEREVTKHRTGLPARDLAQTVEDELRRLSVVAFAMFNRATQWVTEADLETDLAALIGAPRPATGADLRSPLRAAEVVLGRFFFVHRAQASVDGDRLETYEFLHATFGEYLIARLTWQVVAGMVARESVATVGFGAAEPVDDELLHALLSFAALTGRAPIVEFLAALAADLDEPTRARTRDLLVGLFQDVHHALPGRRFDGYRPLRLPVPARYAAYSANLLVLAVCAAGSLRGADLYPDGDLVTAWHRQALLWRSQLRTEDWTSLVDALDLERRWAGPARDLTLSLVGRDRVFVPPRTDLTWTYNLRTRRRSNNFAPPGQSFDRLARTAHFQCGVFDDLLVHTLEPVAVAVPSAINLLPDTSAVYARTAAHDLLCLFFAAYVDTTYERIEHYQRALGRSVRFGLPDIEAERYLASCLDRLHTDRTVPPRAAADILLTVEKTMFVRGIGPRFQMNSTLLRCALAVLERDPGPHPELNRVIWNVVERLREDLPSDRLFEVLALDGIRDRLRILLTAVEKPVGSADGGGDGEGVGGGGDADDEGPFVDTIL